MAKLFDRRAHARLNEPAAPALCHANEHITSHVTTASRSCSGSSVIGRIARQPRRVCIRQRKGGTHWFPLLYRSLTGLRSLPALVRSYCLPYVTSGTKPDG